MSTGLRNEIRVGWRRMWSGRVVPILIVGSAVLIAAVHAVAPTPAGAVHSELAQLRGANEITGFALMIIAFVSAYLLLAPDLHDEFESLNATGWVRPVVFAAGRVLVGAGVLLLAAVVFGIAAEALDVGGQYQRQEALHVLVLFANAVPVFMLALLLTCIAGRGAGLVAAFFLLWVGSDAAYERGAFADHFIGPSGLLSAEQVVGWLSPRQLIDPLPGIALLDQSVALNQFPVREGQAVWGSDLIQVSGSADIAQYAAYLVAAAALLYLVCLFRAGRARSRFHLVPSWLEARRDERDNDIKAPSQKPLG